MNKKVGLVIGLLLALSATICLNINTVNAGVPSIEKVVVWKSGNDTILNITVNHQTTGNIYPNQLDYCDRVVVEIDGVSHTMNLGDTSQTSQIFTIQYNMEEVTGTPTVRVVAACSVLSIGDWSEPIVIPEFQLVHLLLILIIVSTATLLVRSKISKKLMR